MVKSLVAFWTQASGGSQFGDRQKEKKAAKKRLQEEKERAAKENQRQEQELEDGNEYSSVCNGR